MNDTKSNRIPTPENATACVTVSCDLMRGCTVTVAQISALYRNGICRCKYISKYEKPRDNSFYIAKITILINPTKYLEILLCHENWQRSLRKLLILNRTFRQEHTSRVWKDDCAYIYIYIYIYIILIMYLGCYSLHKL